jgi:hypothetical protein
MTFKSIVFACLSLIQKIQASGMNRSGVGTVVGNIKRLSAVFSSWSFKHVSRLCNGIAHSFSSFFKPSLCKLLVAVIAECTGAELYNAMLKEKLRSGGASSSFQEQETKVF